MALYDTAVTVDSRSGSVQLWAWDLTGEGVLAAERRLARWETAIDDSIRLPVPGATHLEMGRSRKCLRPRDLPREGATSAGIHRGG